MVVELAFSRYGVQMRESFDSIEAAVRFAAHQEDADNIYAYGVYQDGVLVLEDCGPLDSPPLRDAIYGLLDAEDDAAEAAAGGQGGKSA